MTPGGKMAVAPCVVSTSRRTVERGWRLKGVALYYHTDSSIQNWCFHVMILMFAYVCPHRLGDYTHTQSFRCNSISFGAQLLFIKPAYANQDPTWSWVSHIWLILVFFNWFEVTKLPTPPETNKEPQTWWFLDVFDSLHNSICDTATLWIFRVGEDGSAVEGGSTVRWFGRRRVEESGHG